MSGFFSLPAMLSVCYLRLLKKKFANEAKFVVYCTYECVSVYGAM